MIYCCLPCRQSGRRLTETSVASAVATSDGTGRPSVASSSANAGPGQDASSTVVVVNGETKVNTSTVTTAQVRAYTHLTLQRLVYLGSGLGCSLRLLAATRMFIMTRIIYNCGPNGRAGNGVGWETSTERNTLPRAILVSLLYEQ
jgi:hypothetical protein